jgi:hypothetical protein
MAEKTIDEQLSEVNVQIHEALRDGNASPGKKRELAEKSIHLTIKKMHGGV